MSFQLPDPNKVVSSLAAFPPRLSVLMEPFTAPESYFENAVKSSGINVPPGPVTTAFQFMRQFESQAGSSQLPSFVAPQPPSAPSPVTAPSTHPQAKEII
jgi:hypothetical protein